MSPTEKQNPETRPPYRGEAPRSEVQQVAPEVLDDREFFLRALKQQTTELSRKIESGYNELDRRLLDLERARLEDKEARIDMSAATVEMRRTCGQVQLLMESDRLQNQDIGALTAIVENRVHNSIRPQVAAQASSEGQLAGHDAGNRVSKRWASVGVVLSMVAVAMMQYCQEQISRGLTEKTAPASSASH
jgi:hypothetical protein